MSDFNATPHVLLVEDDPVQTHLWEAFFEETKRPDHLHIVHDGLEAWQYLQQVALHGGAPRPNLIFLDLELPGLSGLDVLERIKADNVLRRIPVVILTVSDEDADAQAAYDRSATAFITKPSTVDEFNEMMKRIEAFWLLRAQLPPSSSLELDPGAL